MSEHVKVPKSVVIIVGGGLIFSLLTVAFVLGRQTAPAPVITPSPTAALALPPSALNTPAPSDLSGRLDAIEKRVDARQNQMGQISVTRPSSTPTTALTIASAGMNSSRTEYFQSIDAIVGRSAFATPQSFSVRLLHQAMSSPPSEFDSLLSKTSQARTDLAAVNPPEDCREHHSLVLGQLDEALRLLGETKDANASGDTRVLLEQLEVAQGSQADAVRLQTIDRALREN